MSISTTNNKQQTTTKIDPRWIPSDSGTKEGCCFTRPSVLVWCALLLLMPEEHSHQKTRIFRLLWTDVIFKRDQDSVRCDSHKTPHSSHHFLLAWFSDSICSRPAEGRHCFLYTETTLPLTPSSERKSATQQTGQVHSISVGTSC